MRIRIGRISGCLRPAQSNLTTVLRRDALIYPKFCTVLSNWPISAHRSLLKKHYIGPSWPISVGLYDTHSIVVLPPILQLQPLASGRASETPLGFRRSSPLIPSLFNCLLMVQLRAIGDWNQGNDCRVAIALGKRTVG